ncbi:hypothetical protein [Nocardia inohanensis]|uniref:hypothetical protein n=1 Tax=Nocardia inohanensis TaxID=209246 RepID=UPI000835468D|nr:hypothetical protein [Nocardia inohanensis]
MSDQRCTHCGGSDLETGFLDDSGDSSAGYTRWIPGPLEVGIFGGAKRMGKPRFQVHAFRCKSCTHLELFAPQAWRPRR